MGVTRIGVSIPEDLLNSFDETVAERGYSSRSEALRDAIRDFITKHAWEGGEGAEVMGVVALTYEHSSKGLEARLTDLQHEFPGNVQGSFHVHLTRDRCIEVMVLRGSGDDIGELVDTLSPIRGVKQVELLTASV